MTLALAHYEASTEPQTAPHNLDAEQAFLGAVLYDNAVYHRVADWLRAEHFYDPVHGRIYEAAAALIGKGSLADAVVLKTKLESDGGLAEIGGTEYLVELVSGAPSGNAAVEYGRMVYDLYLRREVMRLGQDMVSDAGADMDVDARALIEHVEVQLFGLAEQKTGSKGFKSFRHHTEVALAHAAAAYERGGTAGLSTGLKALDDQMGGLHPSDLIILAARPSMGKTSLVTNIAHNVARNYEFEIDADGVRKTKRGGIVGFFSLEMSGDQLSQRMICDMADVPGWKVRKGMISPAEFERLRDAGIELSGLPIHIDDTGGLPIALLAARARRLKRQHGLDLLVIDYIQLAAGSKRGGHENRVQEVTEITTALKALAKELEVPVIALSQLSRQVENRPDKKPQLSDLRESGSIEQDADVVLFVYREAYYKEREKPREDTPEYLAWEDEFASIRDHAEVIIGKQRHGPIGTAKLRFDGERTRFSDWPEYAS